MEEGTGKAGAEVGKRGMAIDNDNAGVAANVAEGLVVRARDDMPAVAAHHAEFGSRDRR